MTDSVATVRIDETNSTSDRVTIHVEHPGHDDGGRYPTSSDESRGRGVTASDGEPQAGSPADVLDVIDTVGLAIAERDVRPRGMARPAPFDEPTEVRVRGG